MGAALILTLVALGGLAAGVLVGRYYVPDDRQLRRGARHGRAYLRALSDVLARDAESAITELRDVVDDNVEDPEPYFALAALFRSRGEHERAIRVHQALAVRERDHKRLRQRALYELGLDFRAAGMPRRATRAMEEVLADEAEHEGGLRAVAALYEEQGRFGDAAGMLRRLAKHRGEAPGAREHHLRVAAGQAAVARGDLDSARHWLKEARACPSGETAHYLVAAAELAIARGNAEAAREHLVQALDAAPGLALHVWPRLWAAERDLAIARAAQARPREAEPESAVDEKPPRDEPTARPALPRGAAPANEPAAQAGQPGEAPPTDVAAAAVTTLAAPSARDVTTLAPSPPALPVGSDVGDPAAAAARARVDARLRALALADERVGLEVALARAALARTQPSADGSTRALAALLDAHPGSLVAQLAASQLALERSDVPQIAQCLARLTAPDGPLAWAMRGRWRCGSCGHVTAQFAWRCPGCRRWAEMSIEVEPGAAPQLRRERRAERRRVDGSAPSAAPPLEPARSESGPASPALPAPGLGGGLSADEIAERDRKRSVLGRAGSWISGVWSGTRGPGAR